MIMRKIPIATYLTADELLEQANKCAEEANALPPGLARQSILKNAAQLRSYAQMKSLLAAPMAK
jgi:hypothetical protein